MSGSSFGGRTLGRWLTSTARCLALALLALVCVARAEDPAGEQVEPLRYRRIFAPADRVADWPRGNERLVPVDPKKFEAAITAAQSASALARLPKASLVRSRYVGALRDDRLEGDLNWEVRPGDQATRVVLSPLSLVLSDYRWAGRTEKPVLGASSGNELSLIADRSDTFQAKWSAPSRRLLSGGLEFALELPGSPVQQFELTLPAGWTITPSVGAVTSKVVDPTKPGRFTIEIGGHTQVTFTLQRLDLMSQSRQAALVRTSTTYEFTGRGTNVTAVWRIEANDEPVTSLRLVLDPGLQLIGAQLGDQAVSFVVEKPDAAAASQVSLRLPQTLRGVSRPLRLEAVAPVILDRVEPLPRLHPVGLAWQEGLITVVMPEPYVIELFEPIHCRQIRTSPLPEPLSGESIELQSFAADATVRWMIARKAPPLRMRQGTTLTIDETVSTAEVMLEARTDSGERFHVTVETAAAWAIESVESVPPGRISDWTVETSGKTTSLTVRLREPITASQPARLQIEARGPLLRRNPPVLSSQLEVIRPPRSQVESQMIAIRADDAAVVRIDDHYQLARLAFANLTAPERELLPSAHGASIVRVDSATAPWRVRFEPSRAQLAATLAVDVRAATDGLVESYQLEVQPLEEPIERWLIHFTHARVEPPRWQWLDGDPGQFKATRLTAEQQTALELPVAGETWEIIFREPQSEPFRISATRKTLFGDEAPVSLVMLPEAIEQQASVAIRAAADVPLVIDNRRLTMSLPQSSPEDVSPIRQAFQYDPRRVSQADAGPALTLRRATTSAASPLAAASSALIEQLSADHTILPSGETIQQVQFSLANYGRDRITLSHTSTWRLELAEINSERSEPTTTTADDRTSIELAIPPHESFVRITTIWRRSQPAFQWWSETSVELPKVDVPVLRQHATVRLPTGYALLRGTSIPSGEPSGQLVQEISDSVWQRWLGPLYRRDRAVFDPFDAHDWQTAPLAESQQNGERALSELAGAFAKTTPDQATRAWSQWIDILARHGIEVWSPASLPIADLAKYDPAWDKAAGQQSLPESWITPTRRGSQLLEQAGLILAVSVDRIAILPAATANLPGSPLVALSQRPLYTFPQIAGRREGDITRLIAIYPTLTPAAQRKIPAASMPRENAAANRFAAAWPALGIDLAANQPARLVVVRRSLISAVAVSLFGITLLMLGRLRRRLFRLHLLACALLWIVALLAPGELTPLAAAMSLAAWASLLWRAWRPATTSKPRTSSDPTTARSHAALLSAGVSGAALLVILLGTATRAEEAAEKAAAPIPSVFIPTDDEGKPTGGNYLVSEGFYSELRRRAAALDGAREDWLLTGAIYRVTMVRNTDGTALELGDLRVSYDLQVSSPDLELVLPLGFESSSEEPIRGALDGRPLEIKRDADGKHARLICPEAGNLRLDLVLQPATKVEDDTRQVKLDIPAIADAKVEAQLPPDAVRFEISSARGQREWSDDQRRLNVALGPTRELFMRWPASSVRGAASTVNLDELTWLRVRPGSVIAEVTLRAKVVNGAVRMLPLLVDPHWRLLPGKQGTIVDHVQTLPADVEAPDAPQTVQVHLSKPMQEPFTVRLSFLQIGASGVGMVRLPRLESASGRLTRRWLALSVDPALDHELNAPDAVMVAVDDFLGQWGPASVAAPQWVVDRAQSAALQIVTRPKEAEITASQSTAITAQPDGLVVHFEATLDTSNAVKFQHRLLTPPELVVEDVSVLEEGLQRAARWSQPAGGDGVVVFLNGPASGEHLLTLRGFLPNTANGPLTLPRLTVKDATIEEATMTVYRQPGVLVEVERPEGLERIETETTPPQGLRLVAAYREVSERAAARLRVRPNDLRLDITQVTTLRPEGNDWGAEIESEVLVEAGSLDSLRFEIPRSWSGPFTLTPPLDYEVVDIPQHQHQLLIVTPRESIADKLRLKIAGPLKLSSGQLVSWPGATPLASGNVERYLRLPRRWGPQQIAWDTDGLRPAEIPASFGTFADAEQFTTQRVAAVRTSAQLQHLRDRGLGAQVRWAEVQVDWESSFHVTGVVRYDLEPGSIESVTFNIPELCKILQVRVAGLVQTPQVIEYRRLRVPLVTELPQTIELVFTSAVDREPTLHQVDQLLIPLLEQVPVLNMSWSVGLPPADVGLNALPRTQATALQQAIARWSSLMTVIERTVDSSSWRQDDEWRRWAGEWRRRAEASQAETEQLQTQTLASAQGKELAEYTTAKQRWARLQASSAVDKYARDPSPKSLAANVEQIGLTIPHSIRERLIFSEQMSVLPVSLRADQRIDWLVRCGLAIVLAVVALAVAIIAGKWHGAYDLLPRRANLLGVAFGTVMWLWLEPSWLGFTLMVVCAVLALRSGFISARDGHSAIHRSAPATN